MPHIPFLKPRKKPKPVLNHRKRDTEAVNYLAIHEQVVTGNGDVAAFASLVYRCMAGLEISTTEYERTVCRRALGSLWFMGERIIKKHKVLLTPTEEQHTREALRLVDLLVCRTGTELVQTPYMVGGLALTM